MHKKHQRSWKPPVRNFLAKNGLDIGQFFILLLTISSLFLWSRSDAKVDSIKLEAQIKSNQENLDKKIESNRETSLSFYLAIQQEMKEFHTKLATQDLEFKMRLLSLEERTRNKE